MIHLDRLVSSTSPGVTTEYNVYDDRTTWFLPYTVPIGGEEGALLAVLGDGTVLQTERFNYDSISFVGADLTEEVVYIGIPYTFEYQMSRIYPRRDKTNAAAVAETRGKLQLRNIDVTCEGDITVHVQGEERPEVTYEATLDGSRDSMRVPVMSNNEQVKIKITNSTPKGLRIARVSWEGYFHTRNRTR
jgi:hypothetical protein